LPALPFTHAITMGLMAEETSALEGNASFVSAMHDARCSSTALLHAASLAQAAAMYVRNSFSAPWRFHQMYPKPIGANTSATTNLRPKRESMNPLMAGASHFRSGLVNESREAASLLGTALYFWIVLRYVEQMPKKTVVLGFLGTSLDVGRGAKRWDRWRPTVAMTQQDDLLIDRVELFYGRDGTGLAKDVKADIALTSPKTDVRLVSMDLRDAWDFEGVYGSLFEFAGRYAFDTAREDYLIHITTGTHVAQICLFLLAESRHIPARLLQTSPSTRGSKRSPQGTTTIIDLDLSKYDALAKRFHQERSTGLSVLKSGIATRNRAFNDLIEQVEHVAAHSRAPILLLGETGVGKSQLAKRIFELKKARHLISGEFAEVNCATLRGDAAMSMLFGHKKGAFTGATADRAGLLRKADKGVLFLDEVAELGLDEQAMLLRAIEEGVFYPMGSDKQSASDFQLMTGTNRELDSCVARGTFRADLYARLNLWSFRLPSLRERREDIEPNLDFELMRISEHSGTLTTMSKESRAAFLKFAAHWHWPGNFRDFNASIVRMATFAHGGRISESVVAEESGRARSGSRYHASQAGEASLVDEAMGKAAGTLDRFDRVQLEDVLRVCRASKTLSEAGRTLFAHSRTAKTSSNDTDRLRKYLAKFGLDFAQTGPDARRTQDSGIAFRLR
jgi:transcriptional regulatory protein RtcR